MTRSAAWLAPLAAVLVASTAQAKGASFFLAQSSPPNVSAPAGPSATRGVIDFSGDPREADAVPRFNGQEMGWEDFYQMVGRPDFAAQYRQHVQSKRILLWGGLAALLIGAGGSAACIAGISNAHIDFASTSSSNYSAFIAFSSILGLAVPLAVLGVVLMIAELTIQIQPAGPQFIRGLADAYNAGPVSQSAAPPSSRLSLVPVALREGGGLALAVQL